MCPLDFIFLSVILVKCLLLFIIYILLNDSCTCRIEFVPVSEFIPLPSKPITKEVTTQISGSEVPYEPLPSVFEED